MENHIEDIHKLRECHYSTFLKCRAAIHCPALFLLFSLSFHCLADNALHHFHRQLAADITKYIAVAVNHKGSRKCLNAVLIKQFS